MTFGAGCAGSSVVTQGTPDTIALSAVTMSAGTASCTVTVNGVTNRASQTNASCAANPAAFTNAAANISGATNVTNAVDGELPGGERGAADAHEGVRGGLDCG